MIRNKIVITSTLKFTWKESFLKMESNKDITLNLMQAAGSDPSAHPDLISSTIPSMGVPFQNALLEGWAKAAPNKASASTNLTAAIVLSGVHWTTTSEIVIVSTRSPWFLYSYFKFSAYSSVPVRIVLECTSQSSTYDLSSTKELSVRESYLIRILIDDSESKRPKSEYCSKSSDRFVIRYTQRLFCCL